MKQVALADPELCCVRGLRSARVRFHDDDGSNADGRFRDRGIDGDCAADGDPPEPMRLDHGGRGHRGPAVEVAQQRG